MFLSTQCFEAFWIWMNYGDVSLCWTHSYKETALVGDIAIYFKLFQAGK